MLPDLVSDVQAILNGTMPAAAVPMPMPFPSAGDISAMSTEDARDRMTVYSGHFKTFYSSMLVPESIYCSLKSLKAHRHASCSG